MTRDADKKERNRLRLRQGRRVEPGLKLSTSMSARPTLRLLSKVKWLDPFGLGKKED